MSFAGRTVMEAPGATFVYCATRPSDVEEAKESIRSLRQHHRTQEILVFTAGDRAEPLAGDAREVALSRVRHSFADKVQAILDAFQAATTDSIVFLDCDTLVVGSVDPAIEALDRFDLMAVQAPRRRTLSLQDVSDAFPELNTGVIAMRRSQAVADLVQRWLDTFVDQLESDAAPASQDQPAFRHAVYTSTHLHFGTLPPEYNCRFEMGAAVDGRVRVLHGRHHRLNRLAKRVNAMPADKYHGEPWRRYVSTRSTPSIGRAIPAVVWRAAHSARALGRRSRALRN